MGFWIAWKFLSIFPGPSAGNEVKYGLGSSLPHFPIIGLLFGGILLGLDQLLGLFLPGFLTSALLLVSLIILTGALHLDGLMDTCDGFAIKTSISDRLQVMADSHVGGFGVAGACCIILIKFAAIVSLPDELRAVGLLLAPTLARWSITYLVLAFPVARKGGLGDVFKGDTGKVMMLTSTLITMVIAVALLSWIGIILMLGLWFIAWVIGKGLSLRLGGLTGDTYGAIIEITEALALIVIVIIGKAGGTSWLDLS